MNNEDNMNTGSNQAPPPNNTYMAFPPEIKKWNWGAFTFNIWWGIGHRTYLPLLCLIPLFNIVWVFICGIKANEWLWQTGAFSSPAELLKSQEAWNRAGFISFIVALIFFVLWIVIFVGVLGFTLSVFNSFNSYSTF